MPQLLEGSCRCGAVRFRCRSHTPQPYQRCYCTICRKTAGGGGYAINLGADARTLEIEGPGKAIGVYRAEIADDGGHCEISTAERNFCSACATAPTLHRNDFGAKRWRSSFPVTLRCSAKGRASKGDGPDRARSSFEARFARASG